VKQANKSLAVAVAAVFAICFLVYSRSLGCGFINWDDQDYILNNSAIRALDWNLLSWAFTNHAVGWWFPLTWISFALDFHFWGYDPFGYHLTNVLLHCVNASLVVLIANRLLGGGFRETDGEGLGTYGYPLMLVLAGLLFAIHPLRVESVAWATERKDVLNGLFSLGSVFCYLGHARMRISGETGVSRQLFLSFSLFICSLMAKQSSVVLPAMFLLIDWYPLDRFSREGAVRLLVEKWPFLLASLAMSLFTIMIGMTDNAMAAGLTITQKLVISGNALFEYGRLMLYPVDIIPLYIIPFPIPMSYSVKSVAIVMIFGMVAASWRRAWIPALWLGFVIPLLPVLALTQNGIQSFAARFTYLPSVAPSIGAAYAFGVASLRCCARTRLVIVCASALILLAYGTISQQLIDVWHNSGSYWSRVIAYQPFDRAYFYRGLYYSDSGNYKAAVADYSTALSIAAGERLSHDFKANILAFRGEALTKWGRYEDAISDFSVSIEYLPHPLYYYHRAIAFKAVGREAESEADLRRAGSARGQIQWVSP
jgi:hypothetical protein